MIRNFSLVRLFFPLIIAISLPLTVYLVYQNTDLRQHASEEAILYLVPDKPSTESGDTISYALSVDSQTIPVKDLQINLSYPAHKVDIAKIDTTDSPFDLPLEEIKGNGVVRLGREATAPVFGKQHIATLEFKAKDSLNALEITAVNGTEVHALDQTNIYKNALSYTLPKDAEPENASILTQVVEALQRIFK